MSRYSFGFADFIKIHPKLFQSWINEYDSTIKNLDTKGISKFWSKLLADRLNNHVNILDLTCDEEYYISCISEK